MGKRRKRSLQRAKEPCERALPRAYKKQKSRHAKEHLRGCNQGLQLLLLLLEVFTHQVNLGFREVPPCISSALTLTMPLSPGSFGCLRFFFSHRPSCPPATSRAQPPFPAPPAQVEHVTRALYYGSFAIRRALLRHLRGIVELFLGRAEGLHVGHTLFEPDDARGEFLERLEQRPEPCATVTFTPTPRSHILIVPDDLPEPHTEGTQRLT